MTKINTIDLFAGCGGLGDGFEQEGHYTTLAVVEWEKAPIKNYCERLKNKWKYKRASEICLRFDMQRTEELFNGWDDSEFGSSVGLIQTLKDQRVDLVIGGPPCQAYSIAGRVRDENGMKDDYRNYLFESYIKVVDRLKPKAFVFENVPGILSAAPDGTPIISKIQAGFSKIGYTVLKDLHQAEVHMVEYGVPQHRDRIIILGLRNDVYGDEIPELLSNFYFNILPSLKVSKMKTVYDAIGDLPILNPLPTSFSFKGEKTNYSIPDPFVPNHVARPQSERDRLIFRMLAYDIISGQNNYVSIDALKDLYTQQTGHVSQVHKYHVLRWNEPSNLIPAHLWKDGLRHIHPDPRQARTITVREAARLQGFPDDFIFSGTRSENYKMIGNAVPPIFSKVLARAVFELLFK